MLMSDEQLERLREDRRRQSGVDAWFWSDARGWFWSTVEAGAQWGDFGGYEHATVHGPFGAFRDCLADYFAAHPLAVEAS